MNDVRFPDGLQLVRLAQKHPRRRFDCGEERVNQWLSTKAWQHQKKRLSVTKVVVDQALDIAGYYTLATAQVDFGDLPHDIAKRLPRRALPVAVLAWLGVDKKYQGQGLGGRLLASALRDCCDAGKTFPFVAVVIDCLDPAAKSFYQRWNFAELPGHPLRLFLSAAHLEAMLASG